jgi:hypothetical protein
LDLARIGTGPGDGCRADPVGFSFLNTMKTSSLRPRVISMRGRGWHQQGNKGFNGLKIIRANHSMLGITLTVVCPGHGVFVSSACVVRDVLVVLITLVKSGGIRRVQQSMPGRQASVFSQKNGWLTKEYRPSHRVLVCEVWACLI